MLLYNVFFIALSLLSFFELFSKVPNSIKKIVVFIFSVVYLFLTTIYAGPMGDYYDYKYYFMSTTISHIKTLTGNRFEYLYELLNYLARAVSYNYWVLRLLLGIIVIILWYKIYCYSYVGSKGEEGEENNLKYAFTMMLVLWSLNFGNIFIIRSTISVSICAYSLQYIQRKKFRGFLFCCLFAIGFHTMSIIWIPAYWIYHKQMTRKYLYIGLVIALTLSNYMADIVLYMSSFLGEKIHNSIRNYIMYGRLQTYSVLYDNRFTTIKAMLNIGILLFVFSCIMYYKKKEDKNRTIGSYYNLYLVGSIIYLVALNSSAALTRAALAYNATQYFLLPKAFDIDITKKNLVIRLLAFALFITYMYLRMLLNIYSNAYIPFNTIL